MVNADPLGRIGVSFNTGAANTVVCRV